MVIKTFGWTVLAAEDSTKMQEEEIVHAGTEPEVPQETVDESTAESADEQTTKAAGDDGLTWTRTSGEDWIREQTVLPVKTVPGRLIEGLRPAPELFLNWEDYSAWTKGLPAGYGACAAELLEGCNEAFFEDNVLLLIQRTSGHYIASDSALFTIASYSRSEVKDASIRYKSRRTFAPVEKTDCCCRIDVPRKYLQNVFSLTYMAGDGYTDRCFSLASLQNNTIVLAENAVDYFENSAPLEGKEARLITDAEQLMQEEWLQYDYCGNFKEQPYMGGPITSYIEESYTADFFEKNVLLIYRGGRMGTDVALGKTAYFRKSGEKAEVIVHDSYCGPVECVISYALCLVRIPREYLEGVRELEIDMISCSGY